MQKRPFTGEDDTYLLEHYPTDSFSALATALGRSYGSVQGRIGRLRRAGQFSIHDRAYQPRWSQEDEDWLADNWGKRSDKAVARHLGRTVVACHEKADRLCVTKKSNLWTAREVGRLFGVDSKTVARWIERGWLTGRQVATRQGPNRLWDIDEDSLEAFIRTMGWAYDWTRMATHEYLSNVARQVALDDPWLTKQEACRELGWQEARLDRWIRRGVLPHKRRPKQGTAGPWQSLVMIRKADLAGLPERVAAIVTANQSTAARRRMAKRYPQSGAAARGHETRRAKRRSEVAA